MSPSPVPHADRCQPTEFQTNKTSFSQAAFPKEFVAQGFWNAVEFVSLPFRDRKQIHYPCPACDSHFLPCMKKTHRHSQFLALVHSAFCAWYLWGTLGIRGQPCAQGHDFILWDFESQLSKGEFLFPHWAVSCHSMSGSRWMLYFGSHCWNAGIYKPLNVVDYGKRHQALNQETSDHPLPCSPFDVSSRAPVLTNVSPMIYSALNTWTVNFLRSKIFVHSSL